MPKGIYKRKKRGKGLFIKCFNCGSEIYLMKSQVTKTNFCSRSCRDSYWSKNRKHRNGGYASIHKWLVKHYGNATKCVNPLCKNKSTIYQWAKLKNKKHEHKRENYIMLCVSCHRKYDITIEQIEKHRQKLLGRKFTKEHKNKISQSMKGKNKGSKNGAWKGGKYAN